MKENVYKHLIITKTDVQDSVSVLRKTWKTIRCKVRRGKTRPGTHGIQIYRLRSRSHVRWRDFKPAVDAACVCSLCGGAVITKVLHQCMQKYIYILFINTLNLSIAYICIISISYLSRRMVFFYVINCILTFSRPRIPLNRNSIAIILLWI